MSKYLLALLILGAALPALASERLSSLVFPAEHAVPFIERQANAMLAEPSELRGTLHIEADGTLVMRVASPFQERRTLRGASVTLERDGRRRSARLRPGKPTHATLIALSALLSGNADALSEMFEVAGEVHGDPWRVTLHPTGKRLQQRLARIELQGSGTQLLYLRAHIDESRWTELTITP